MSSPRAFVFAAVVAAGIAGGIVGCAAAPSGPVTASIESVEIDDDGLLSASGHVQGVSEEGGQCRFTFWSPGGGASRLTSTGAPDGARTSCGKVSETSTMLLSGDYELELTYESESTTVTSARVPVTIP